jgi:phosphate:Na+ symporter
MQYKHTAGGTRRWTALIAGIAWAIGWFGTPSWTSVPRAPSTSGAAHLEYFARAAADEEGLSPPSIGSQSKESVSKPNEGQAASARGGGAARKPDTAKGDDAASGHKSLDWFAMAMSAVAGLVLFIYGVTRLANGLGDLNSERMRRVTARFTSNRIAGVATGFVATTLLESSSVTIIMVIAMVSGGVLTFVQSLGVVLGANIGTAVGAQIIALEFERYVPLLMLSGLLLLFIGKSETRHKLGVVVLGFGFMFYGLEAIDEAMKPLRDHEPFMHAMETMGQEPVLGALFGAVFTMMIQSSSATVAVIITLAGSGLISLPAGVAIMLGAEIGTCSDTLVATIGRGRPALRTGVFHLVFNLLAACVGVALAPAFVNGVNYVSGDASVGHKIANAQMIFNCVGVALVLPFLSPIARLLERVIPDAARNAQAERKGEAAAPAQ